MNTIRYEHKLQKGTMLSWEHIDELLKQTVRGYDLDDTNDLADMIAHNGMTDVETYKYIVPQRTDEKFSIRFDMLCQAIGSRRVMDAVMEIVKQKTADMICNAEADAYDIGVKHGRENLQNQIKITLGIA